MTFKPTKHNTIFAILWITMFIYFTIADCPISYYPESTFVGKFTFYFRFDSSQYWHIRI